MSADHSGIRRTPDVERMTHALGGPSSDTRAWVSMGKVLRAPTREGSGLYVDVQLVPLDLPLTCRVAAIYSGPGIGIYAPLRADEEVVVLIPDGELDSGGVVVGRMPNALDPLPDEFDNETVVLRAKEGENAVVAVSGGGKVQLGTPNSGKAPVLWEDLVQFLNTLIGRLDTHTHTTTTNGSPTGPAQLVPGVPNPFSVPPIPTQPMRAQDVEAS